MTQPGDSTFPKWLGLCLEHAREFYYPLTEDEKTTCPACGRPLVVYRRESNEPTTTPVGAR